MQTFLPTRDFSLAASQLDNKRLSKQALEGCQIMNALVQGEWKDDSRAKKTSWFNHPTAKMWRGHENILLEYLYHIDLECRKRNFNNNQYQKTFELLLPTELFHNNKNPIWFNNPKIFSSHRSRLKCKGFIDEVCRRIKQLQKIRNINNWLKLEYNKEKNQLRYFDGLELCDRFKIDIDQMKEKSYYFKHGWDESYEQDYVWPVN